jgi:uncharacterized protein YbgA (DUF1722 family)/uncharacterized protein YbbK (DUF523 family)
MSKNTPTIGIGACLVGQPVRYNGDSKRQHTHIEKLKEHFAMSSYCPEMAIGLGVPRETVRLVGELGDIRLSDSSTQSKDYTDPMESYAAEVLAQNSDLDGYILVKDSPSCGYERVKRYNEKGNVAGRDATGLFTAALRKLDPLLPMEDEGRLHDPVLRENFITRVYAYQDWKKLYNSGISHHKLTTFWARYKYLVMAHHVSGYQKIGRLLANLEKRPLADVADDFVQLFMESLALKASKKSHANVLQHLLGYLKRKLPSADKQEMSALIEQYRKGVIPLVVPITVMRHHFSHSAQAYIDQQVYMQPYPDALSLRNNI